MKYLPWILAILGSWLIAAPFVLDYATTEVAKRNDVSIGLAMLFGTCVWRFLEWIEDGRRTDMHAQRQ